MWETGDPIRNFGATSKKLGDLRGGEGLGKTLGVFCTPGHPPSIGMHQLTDRIYKMTLITLNSRLSLIGISFKDLSFFLNV